MRRKPDHFPSTKKGDMKETTNQEPAKRRPSSPRSGLALLCACAVAPGAAFGASFSDDVAFLQKHTDVIVLSNRTGSARVAVVPSMQGRIMTSTSGGERGASFGWINRELIASKKFQPHINVFGGEDRFWMGPEGGQFSIFFAKGSPFELAHWFTPAPIDTEPFELVKQSRSDAQFRRSFSLTNYSGTRFEVAVDRTIRLLGNRNAWQQLGIEPAEGVNLVAFESINRVTNAGKQPWKKETGLLSIWVLGMFNPSPATTVVIPIKAGPEKELGPRVNADYFGKVPPDRLVTSEDVIFFSGDGEYRSKIGVGPLRSKPIMGSYDAAGKVLTLVQFTLPAGETNYVNSMWELQDNPYGGDVVNSYNDGPPAPGAKPLGPFYELESSSPAAALEPGRTIEHMHRTMHLSGPEVELDRIARHALGVSLRQISDALPRPKPPTGQ
jgi:hypothetical protein